MTRFLTSLDDAVDAVLLAYKYMHGGEIFVKKNKSISVLNFLKNLDSSTKLLFADVNSQTILKNDNIKKGEALSILIGPEGDFSPAERESILTVPDVKSFTISKNILRSDTAVITAISLVNFVYFNS